MTRHWIATAGFVLLLTDLDKDGDEFSDSQVV